MWMGKRGVNCWTAPGVNLETTALREGGSLDREILPREECVPEPLSRFAKAQMMQSEGRK